MKKHHLLLLLKLLLAVAAFTSLTACASNDEYPRQTPESQSSHDDAHGWNKS